MAKKKFFIGDILNLLFYDVNDECELFLDDDRSEGIDDLLAFMLGLSTDPQKSPEKLKKIGVSEAADYFEDNHRFSLAMQVCIESLLCQFECFTERRFRDELKSMKKRANKSSFGEEIETNWLTQQWKRLRLLKTLSIPFGQTNKLKNLEVNNVAFCTD